jgi:hypothetical protein
MPYIYSIRTEIYDDGIPPEKGKWKRADRIEFNVVPQAVAEADPEGHYKLVRNDGYEVTGWNYILSEYRAEDTTKVGTGKPLKDALGTEHPNWRLLKWLVSLRRKFASVTQEDGEREALKLPTM